MTTSGVIQTRSSRWQRSSPNNFETNIFKKGRLISVAFLSCCNRQKCISYMRVDVFKDKSFPLNGSNWAANQAHLDFTKTKSLNINIIDSANLDYLSLTLLFFCIALQRYIIELCAISFSLSYLYCSQPVARPYHNPRDRMLTRVPSKSLLASQP